MDSHVIDSTLYGESFRSPEIAAIFSERARIQRWLDVERALAEAQAELGMIPSESARRISEVATLERLDVAAIGKECSEVRHQLVPVIRALERECGRPAGEYVHFGATTQDIQDTGLMLQAKAAWRVLVEDARATRAALAALASRHRLTVMMGRSHGQHALPITFGFKVAVWVDEIDRHLARCAEAEPRVFVGNLSGAVGTMASFGERGEELQRAVLGKLGLGVPRITWHTSRDRLFELATILCQLALTAGKIAGEVSNLQRTELDELAEAFHHGKVGSSTMPHKRNPASADLLAAVARLVRAQLVAVSDAVLQEHERDGAAWRVEWAAIPEMFVYAGAAMRQLRLLVSGLEVHEDRMRGNCELLGGLALSERVMFVLGAKIGKQAAHDVVYEVCMRAVRERRSFRDALREDERVRTHLDGAAIDALLDPTAYLGLAARLTDAIVAT
jgi:adenylosuccinate lyase